jgi:hypothetical protein
MIFLKLMIFLSLFLSGLLFIVQSTARQTEQNSQISPGDFES